MKYIFLFPVLLALLCASCATASFSKYKGVGRIKRYDIYNKQLPDSFDGFRIAFVSDFHYESRFSFKRLKGMKQALQAVNADVLLLGGDYRGRNGGNLAELFDALSEVKTPYGTYAVMGNHDLNENYPHNLSIQLNTNFANNEVLREVKFNKSFNTNAISVRAKISFESDNLLASELVDQLNQIDFNIATLSGECTWSERINGYYFLVNSTNKMYQLQTNDIITLSNGVIIPDIIFESEDYKNYCSDIVLKVELQALWNVGGYSIEEADVNFSNKYGGSAFN